MSTGSGLFSKYFSAYVVCFSALLLMLCTFKLVRKKTITFTRMYIVLFSAVMFAFVSVLGTIFEPKARATLYIVYVLVLPMLFVIPTHCMYGFLSLTTTVFSVMALQVKVLRFAEMDIAHAVTCIVIGVFLSYHILQSRISILLSQIQPHFLFNTLTAICGLFDQNPQEARRVTSDFADYLRHKLETINQRTPVPFEAELRHTKIYLRIEQKRFEERLNIAYDIAVSNFRIPALTIQPLVENAVKHGVTKQKKGGTVTIATREHEDCYEITITDNGLGFAPSKPLEETDTHIGIKNVRDRLWSLCEGTLTIESEVGAGTAATIKIPKGRM